MAYKKIIGWKSLLLFVSILAVVTIGLSFFIGDISLELSIIASLFTFVYGFFLNSIFKFVDGKASRFRDYMGQFQGSALAIGSMLLLTNQPKFMSEMKKTLCSFLGAFLVESPDDYHKTQKKVPSLYAAIRQYSIKTEEDKQIYSRIIQQITALTTTRENLELFGHRYLVGEMKIVYLVFTGVLSVMILLLTLSHPSLLILGFILVLLLIFVSRLLFMLDQMAYGREYVIDENIKQLIAQLKLI
ncbi:hypothetical protein HYT55_04535 [Candidatus Woesearchaeota archaeon]|nr:hypothetical protein [Candidatus Woesearchaeota archaeon]